MTQVRTKRALVIGRELGIVVLGVLIALAADSWWEGHQDRARASANVGALRADLDSSLESLDVVINNTSSHLEAFEGFLEELVSDGPLPPTTEVHMPRMFNPHLRSGTLDALVETGDLRLFDERLRGAILGHRAGYMTISTRLAQSRAAEQEAVEDVFHALEALRVPGRSANELPLAEEMRGDPALLALFRAHRYRLRQDITAFERLRESVVSLREQLDG